MIRFLLRFLGLVAVAGGFVMMVIDGTRSIANSTFAMTPLSDMAVRAFPRSFPEWGPVVARNVHPLLWDPVLTYALLIPAFAAGLGLGLLLLWLGQRRAEPIGFDTKS